MATTTVTTSKQFSLNWQDVIKGLKVAVLLPALTIIYKSIEAGSFVFDWKLIGLTAAGGFISYLIKNFLTPAEIVVKDASKETVQAVKDGDKVVTVE